jgi:hypothetical protein
MEDKSNWSTTLVYFVAWLVCSILLIVDILMIREASKSVMTAIQARQVAMSEAGEAGRTLINTGFIMRAIDTSLIFGGMIVAAALAIAIEVYFRRGKEKGLLWKRIGQVLGIEVAIILVSVVIQTFV